MNLIITKKKLIRMLDIINLANSTNTIDHTMGCACMEASTKTNRLRLYKSGNVFSYVIDDCKVIEGGKLNISINVLLPVILKLSEDDIEITLVDTTLMVKSGTTSLQVPTRADLDINLNEYNATSGDSDTLIELSSKAMQLAINKTKGANEHNCPTASLQAYYMNFDDDGIRLSSATSKGMSSFKIKGLVKQHNHDLKLISPSNGINEIYKFASLAGENLKLIVHDASMIILGSGAYIGIKYMACSPVDLDKVKLKHEDAKFKIKLDGNVLKSKISLVLSLPKTTQIDFQYSNNLLKIVGKSITHGEVSEEMIVNGMGSIDLKWSLDSTLLSSYLPCFPNCDVMLLSSDNPKRTHKQFEYDDNMFIIVGLSIKEKEE